MRKKILSTIILIVLLAFTCVNTANAQVREFSDAFSVDIPSNYRIDVESDEVTVMNEQSGEVINFSATYEHNNKREINQSVLDAFLSEVRSSGYSKIYQSKLTQLNGCEGIYVYLYGGEKGLYVKFYGLVSDNYIYAIMLASINSNFSKQSEDIIKSFKIKDTVSYTRGIPFIDVENNSPYFNSIKFNNEKGIILGTSKNTFNPNGSLTRGQIVTMLHRMEGYPKAGANAKRFKDVIRGPYYDAIMWASSYKIVNGYENGNFGPNNKVTREQLATFLKNYADYKKVNTSKRTDITKYKDYNRVESHFRDNVSWAVAEGIIKGTDNFTKISPKGYATRAQAAAMLSNFYEIIK